MGDEVMLIQSRSGMIHVAGCTNLGHGVGASGGVSVTASDLELIGPYSRCRRCAPPIPGDATIPASRFTGAGALTHDDLGRDTELGRIEEIRHRSGEIVVGFDHGCTWVFAPDDLISFL